MHCCRRHRRQERRDFRIRDTYDPALTDYEALDVVTMNATWFVARTEIRGRALGRAGSLARSASAAKRRARAEEANVGRRAKRRLKWFAMKLIASATP